LKNQQQQSSSWQPEFSKICFDLGDVAEVESGTAGLSTGEAFFSIDLVFQDNGIATTLIIL
jgi:hypothetical protein